MVKMNFLYKGFSLFTSYNVYYVKKEKHILNESLKALYFGLQYLFGPSFSVFLHNQFLVKY